MSEPRPLAISLGDPCGIGAEVTAKALCALGRERRAAGLSPQPVRVYGSARVLAMAWARFASDEGDGEAPPCVDVGALGEADVVPGKPTEAGLRSSALAVVAAVEAVQRGECSGLCTAPLVKKALALAGHAAPGHTELLQRLAGVPLVAMMLGGEKLRVIVGTTHCALRDVPAKLAALDLTALIELTSRELRAKLGIANPRLGLCALNPHAGESGLFGDEETTLLQPALEKARAAGVNVRGPYPSDTLFARAVHSGEYDAIVALYHDQALIPVKLLHLGNAVNTTLGLPFVRTSPDHGVAYDIAGLGLADGGSMRAALAQAFTMVERSRCRTA